MANHHNCFDDFHVEFHCGVIIAYIHAVIIIAIAVVVIAVIITTAATAFNMMALFFFFNQCMDVVEKACLLFMD